MIAGMTLDRLHASAPHGVTSNLFGGTYAEGWIGYICGHVNPHENCKTNPERDIWELGWLDARRAGARDIWGSARKLMGFSS